jgi:23S rRNA-/tRNA-specific pseudouridylate synthase
MNTRALIQLYFKIYLSPNYNEDTSFILDKPKGANTNRKNAITKYRILDANKSAALVECQPLTGIKHQIRVHLSFALGCPILGDHKYSHHLKLAPQVSKKGFVLKRR